MKAGVCVLLVLLGCLNSSCRTEEGEAGGSSGDSATRVALEVLEIPFEESETAWAVGDDVTPEEELLNESLGSAAPPKAIPVGEEGPEEESVLAVALEAAPPVEVIAPEILESKDFNVFYIELSRFGEWFRTEEFGYVWQPRVATTEKDWRPYTRGRWVDSEQGWVWVSDEPFGWATYHYGRWALLENQGWVWIPGEDWAPAWVSWRQADDHVGWAPLPPETCYVDDVYFDSGIDTDYGVDPSWYNFVPVASFHEPVIRHCLPGPKVGAIWRGSVNVTIIKREHGKVHCHGPGRDWVKKRSGRSAKHCRVHRHAKPVRFDRYGRGRLNDGAYEVFAPDVGARWNPAARPPSVRKELGGVRVARGRHRMSEGAARRFARDSTRRQREAGEAVRSEEAREAWNRQRRAHERITAERERRRGIEQARREQQAAEARQRAEKERQHQESERKARAERERLQARERARREEQAEEERQRAEKERQRQESERKARVDRERRQAQERVRRE